MIVKAADVVADKGVVCLPRLPEFFSHIFASKRLRYSHGLGTLGSRNVKTTTIYMHELLRGATGVWTLLDRI